MTAEMVHTVKMTRSLRVLLGTIAVVGLLAIGAGLAFATGTHRAPSIPAVATSHNDDAVENSTAADHEQEPADTAGSTATASPSQTGASGNHGAVVSQVARETPPGPQHGTIVSAAARDNHGAAVSKQSTHAGS